VWGEGEKGKGATFFFPISAMLQPVSTTSQCGFRFLLQHKADVEA
jgi:hypothetical protein